MKVNAKTYILSKLSELVNDISELKLIYKYDSLSREHLIKVFPINEYNTNEKFHKIEEEILFDFIDKYPYECLVFFTEDEWIDINNPDEIFEGADYIIESKLSELLESFKVKFTNNELFAFSNIKEDFIQLSEEVLTNYSKIQLEIARPVSFTNYILQDFYGINNIKNDCVFNANFETYLLNVKGDFLNEEHNCEAGCGCDNYALAA